MLEKHNHAKIVPCGHCGLVFESFSHLRHHHVLSTNTKRKCEPVEPIAINGDNPGDEQHDTHNNRSSFERGAHLSVEEESTTGADFASFRKVLEDTFNKEFCTKLVITALEAEKSRMGEKSKSEKLQQNEENQASEEFTPTQSPDSIANKNQTENEKMYQSLINKAVEMILNRGTHSDEDLVSVSFWERMIIFADFKVTNYLKDNASKKMNIMRTPAKVKVLGKRAPCPRRAFSPSPSGQPAASTKKSTGAKPSIKKASKPSMKKATKPSIKKATKTSAKKGIKPLIKKATKPLQKAPARSVVVPAKAPSSVKSSGTPTPKAAPTRSNGRHATQAATPSTSKAPVKAVTVSDGASTRRGNRKTATPSAPKARAHVVASAGTPNRVGVRKTATPTASKARANVVASVGTPNRGGIRKTAAPAVRRDSVIDPKLVLKGSRPKKNKVIFDPTN
ncbi:hypothetical protein B9Z55_022449 [Caenorhabditis nigoni]|nr:hypothetical protein B9Z55_022449 [Caenorhabditis nigoni]